MRTVSIILVCVLQSLLQGISAQNLTLEVRGVEKVEGHLYVAIILRKSHL